MSLPQLHEVEWARPSVPRPGSSLASATEAKARHIRAAVAIVRGSLCRHTVSVALHDLFASRWCHEPLNKFTTTRLRAAWNLVSTWIVARSVDAIGPNTSLHDAEAWFVGNTRPSKSLASYVSKTASREAIRSLELLTYDDELRDLLPYVLDAHGPGSRASVRRDPTTLTARKAKRRVGSFYTPSDVADYIIGQSLGGLDPQLKCPRILDPACGSGVFLRAALAWAGQKDPTLDRLRFVEEALHGIDIDLLAIESACFVLLHDILASNPATSEPSPWSLWHRIRCNLFVGDALHFQLGALADDCSDALQTLRATVATSYRPPARHRRDIAAALFSNGVDLGSIFPALRCGADAVVGNPPYASLGVRDDAVSLRHRFASLPARSISNANAFPLFVEMMWKLARDRHASSGMVVPLSIAYSTRQQMVRLRESIAQSRGTWRFAFFDREPHALFGEEVKTRNAIVFRCHKDDHTRPVAIETGPLHKWSSRQRSRLFKKIRYVPLSGRSITPGIPKLGDETAVAVYKHIERTSLPLGMACAAVSSCLPMETTSAATPRVFVGATAYNYISVFRAHRSRPPQVAPWSNSKVLGLDFDTEQAAKCAFAGLASRLAFWLWRVSEDGFHVNRSFVVNLPLGQALSTKAMRSEVSVLGTRLWTHLQSHQIVSVNGGRQTVGYRPLGCDHLLGAIDRLLLMSLGIPATFGEYLAMFCHASVRAGEQPKGVTLDHDFRVHDNDSGNGGLSSA